jgi:hypothetical protein
MTHNDMVLSIMYGDINSLDNMLKFIPITNPKWMIDLSTRTKNA